ncbi:expressed unknown protein [Ectocarpus siliculosus]|uniref:Uncharacterized protein n=1 Tax=Ectocarpus siliculosus TaxID=2880 RepID=D7FIX6_ECTSI|nr:expressed unknown protein [Ectocarpus siliculosus]|eukprot:CBJ28924.1 expressed unknown protein [Ectocarpus siliculosus]
MAITRKTFIDPPVLRKPLAFVLLVINVFVPGLGTVIAGFLTCKLKSIFTGILQLVTTSLVVGWVWSVMWGWELWTLARRHPFTPLLDP